MAQLEHITGVVKGVSARDLILEGRDGPDGGDEVTINIPTGTAIIVDDKTNCYLSELNNGDSVRITRTVEAKRIELVEVHKQCRD